MYQIWTTSQTNFLGFFMIFKGLMFLTKINHVLDVDIMKYFYPMVMMILI